MSMSKEEVEAWTLVHHQGVISGRTLNSILALDESPVDHRKLPLMGSDDIRDVILARGLFPERRVV